VESCIGVVNLLPPEWNAKWPKLDWVVTALQRNGNEVRVCRNRDGTEKLFSECDYVILGHKSISGRWVNLRDRIKDRKCPAVYWWFDLVATHPNCHISAQPLFSTFKDTFRESDIVLVKEHSLLNEYRESGVNAYWFDQGVLSDFPIAIHKKNPKWDILLWGHSCSVDSNSNAWRDRYKDAKFLAEKGFKVAWATPSSTVPNGIERLPWTHPNELHELAADARCVLSVGYRNDIRGYWSDSFWMAVGMGNVVIRRNTEGIPDGPYLRYTDRDELLEKADWSINNPIDAMREGAREWATTSQSLETKTQTLTQLVKTATEKAS